RTGQQRADLQAEHRFADRPYALLQLALSGDRGELYRRIDERVEAMFDAGLVEETADLLASGYSPALKALRTIGYREVIRHLQGDLSRAETIGLIQRETRHYAKRQLTWFRQDKEIIWVDSARESDRIHALIDNFMRDKRSGHG
ncbi:MAG: tRNA (adenosine(37)-N6)-dimethylallyltransferase MiaA, partial [Desulfuromonadales bacterium]|nr:tRNA (adenosine(37)-N6)-dimethylallyltransferase MiaA [Desulfuromonadales bacterium]